MGDARDNLGKADEPIKAGLRRAGPGRQSAMSTGNAGGSGYYGKELTEAQQYTREGLRASGPPMRSGPLPNNDARAKQIGDKLTRDAEARIAESMPREAPTEPAMTAEQMIRAGLGAARLRDEAAARAKADSQQKVRKSW
jgi:hypothetical protein